MTAIDHSMIPAKAITAALTAIGGMGGVEALAAMGLTRVQA